jgi:hypothetical protein
MYAGMLGPIEDTRATRMTILLQAILVSILSIGLHYSPIWQTLNA